MKFIISVRDIFINAYKAETFEQKTYKPHENEIVDYKFLQCWGAPKGSGISHIGLQAELDKGAEFYLLEETENKKGESYMLAQGTIFRFFKKEEMTRLKNVEEIFSVCEAF